MNNQAAQTMPELPEPFDTVRVNEFSLQEAPVFSAGQMRAMYQQGYAAALSQTAGVAEPGRYFAGGPQGHFFADDLQLARDLVNLYDKDDDWTITDLRNPTGAAPAASGGEDGLVAGIMAHFCNAIDNLNDMPVSDEWARKWTAKAEFLIGMGPDPGDQSLSDTPNQTAAASVSERARELLAAEYRTHGWHEDAGRLRMGGDPTSFVEDDALRVITRLIEQGDEDTHVITELGRLLASIAVILKGPEPAGTAWSYHDLPALVASEVAEPRQVAAEMKAWAHTKMADQQSSRRDRMMVAEWAKRLLPESSFPVKDFDVEGMSITKEAAREAVKRVALEQALTQQREDGAVRREDFNRGWMEGHDKGWPSGYQRAMYDASGMPKDFDWNAAKAQAMAAYGETATPASASVPEATDADIEAWLERHDLAHAIRGTDARAAFEDAQMFAMLAAASGEGVGGA